jgi:hypothetical protein
MATQSTARSLDDTAARRAPSRDQVVRAACGVRGPLSEAKYVMSLQSSSRMLGRLGHALPTADALGAETG